MAFFYLTASHLEHVLSLFDSLCKVIVSHGFSLCSFLVVNGFTTVLVRISRCSGIDSLQLSNVSLGLIYEVFKL